jgi:hypothetical protein
VSSQQEAFVLLTTATWCPEMDLVLWTVSYNI